MVKVIISIAIGQVRDRRTRFQVLLEKNVVHILLSSSTTLTLMDILVLGDFLQCQQGIMKHSSSAINVTSKLAIIYQLKLITH